MKEISESKKQNFDRGGVEWYREKIIEMIENIENIGTLKYLHRFLELFLEKWG